VFGKGRRREATLSGLPALRTFTENELSILEESERLSSVALTINDAIREFNRGRPLVLRGLNELQNSVIETLIHLAYETEACVRSAHLVGLMRRLKRHRACVQIV